MAENQKVVIAGSNFLANLGLKYILSQAQGFELVAECNEGNKLLEVLLEHNPNLLIINYSDESFGLPLVQKVSSYFPSVRMLAITPPQPKSVISSAIDAGILSHLQQDCAKDEIIEALISTSRNEKFFCGKIVNHMMGNEEIREQNESLSCEGFRISAREVEIIRLVAEGFTNKQIAEKLFLSTHTVMTHRKNIMSKIGVNNTAGLVFFAIKNGIITPNKYLFSSSARN